MSNLKTMPQAFDDNQSESSDETTKTENDDEEDPSKKFIIKHDCTFTIIWRILYIFMNLSSAYFYSWLACFG